MHASRPVHTVTREGKAKENVIDDVVPNIRWMGCVWNYIKEKGVNQIVNVDRKDKRNKNNVLPTLKTYEIRVFTVTRIFYKQ